MSIVQATCTSYKKELFLAIHDHAVAGDVFKIALYTSSAAIDSSTTAYSATDEVSGSGYPAGGVALTNVAPSSVGTTAITSFANVVITASVTARGALIYNSSKANRAVAVLNFGRDIDFTAGKTVTFPTVDASNAILRVA